jgi:DNA-binding SARP family transcriptional activator
VEAFYQGLMRCYRALDRGCEAISAYQRMRQLFSITLGIEPTAESEWLYRTLLADRMESTGAPLAGWRKIAR